MAVKAAVPLGLLGQALAQAEARLNRGHHLKPGLCCIELPVLHAHALYSGCNAFAGNTIPVTCDLHPDHTPLAQLLESICFSCMYAA